MKRLTILFLLVCIINATYAQVTKTKLKDKYVLVVHGGAGTILKSQMTPEKEKAYISGLENALQIGNEILKNGGSAIDAVEAAVIVLENDSLFNAGKGAVFTNEGKNELDAAIMDGKTLSAGSVAGITTVKNPIKAARAVMEKSPHVMMTGLGAEQFAKQQGLEIVAPSYFFTENRWQGLQKAKENEKEKQETDSVTQIKRREIAFSELFFSLSENGKIVGGKYGTVGAVALDRYGNLAAATSTGGMTNKRYGRVGDAPLIGAGTYANNSTVAISCTGWGEYFIRLVMAKSISDMIEFGKMKLEVAATEMVMKRLPAIGGDGGLIAVDKLGNISMPFCTPGMYRAYIKNDGIKVIKIYKE
ncbi:MAG: isoaspartyl peptidase/L-asparaginase [Chitinophagaceae bacterium]|nr:isoaspartyl peptidase/L-asparaginase [Chitinophagaceae bacterium]